MSLNEKYIINGSTLSDIGDALRSSKIYNPSTKIESAKVLTCTIPYSIYNKVYSNEINKSTFSFVGKNITHVKIFVSSGSTGSPGVTNRMAASGNVSLLQGWENAQTLALPIQLKAEASYFTQSGKFIIVPMTIDGEYIQQDDSLVFPSYYTWSWEEYSGAGRTIPNPIEVSDIASVITNFSNKEYQYYTFSTQVTGDNIHKQTYHSSKVGMVMPLGVDYTKMVYCRLRYSDMYDFTYIRDIMPYIASQDKTKIFFPCFYYYNSNPTLKTMLDVRSLRNSSNPCVSGQWYGIGYDPEQWGNALIYGGVQITGLYPTNITLKYAGGLGQIYGNNNVTVAVFEK